MTERLSFAYDLARVWVDLSADGRFDAARSALSEALKREENGIPFDILLDAVVEVCRLVGPESLSVNEFVTAVALWGIDVGMRPHRGGSDAR